MLVFSVWSKVLFDWVNDVVKNDYWSVMICMICWWYVYLRLCDFLSLLYVWDLE